MISIEEWNELSRSIVAAVNDQAALTSLVTQATDEYGDLYATHAETAGKNEQLEQENENLRKANMDLFLRIGADTAARTQEKNQVKSKAESITINDLFKKEDK